MAYFKRATVYLALGRAKSALHDMERVIELKPDFILVKRAFTFSTTTSLLGRHLPVTVF